MVNIYKNKLNKVTTDVTSFFTSVWLCNHISSDEWYIFLVRYNDESTSRYNVFTINEAESLSPDLIDKIDIDIINSKRLYFYDGMSGNINATLPESEYNVYLTYTEATEIDETFVEEVKEYLNEIVELTEDDNFRLYLKYNATIMTLEE